MSIPIWSLIFIVIGCVLFGMLFCIVCRVIYKRGQMEVALQPVKPTVVPPPVLTGYYCNNCEYGPCDGNEFICKRPDKNKLAPVPDLSPEFARAAESLAYGIANNTPRTPHFFVDRVVDCIKSRKLDNELSRFMLAHYHEQGQM